MSNDSFLRACRLEKTPYTPVWLMRQAGRYMKEYMAIRKKRTFLEMCRTPEIATEVTLQPIRKFNLDAAIIFADILLPLEGMGVGLRFAKDEGPVIKNPVRTTKAIDAIRIIEPEEDVPYLLKALSMVKSELNSKVPLLGFSGAPFTIASYIIEGGASRNYMHTKAMMYNDPGAWKTLMNKISEILIGYLDAQIRAGADAVQVFDSWVGCLGPDDYRAFVLPYTKRLISTIKRRHKKTPVINFSTNTGSYIEHVGDAGGDVIGVDWRIRLDDAWKRIGYGRAIQGNLDPTVLFSSPKEIRKRTKGLLEMAGGRPGHIFNLGHGIILGTPVDSVRVLVDSVHELSGGG
ncbi:MAG: uroporphyrinogen decarboxylase [Deltaproteobacteria bacterium]